jgi:hypothetical protein
MPTPRAARKRRVPARDRVAELVATLQVRSDCPCCGKCCYGSRKTAKKAARLLYPGTHMIRYRCRGYWHLTSETEQRAQVPGCRKCRKSRKRRKAGMDSGILTPAAA